MYKRTIRSMLAAIVALVMLFAFVGCQGNADKATITLDPTEISIGVGDSKRITATVSDGSTPKWSSSDEDIVLVVNGMVRGVAAGKAIVTASLESGASATCEVTVQNITVKISDATAQIERGETKQLTATVQLDGQDMAGESVTWTSSNESVATVKDGLVTAEKEGTATITARRAGAGSAASATCEVTVIWTNKPAGYYELADRNEDGELINNGSIGQNKVAQGRWAYWGDMGGWNGGSVEFSVAEYQDAEGSQAGTVHLRYEASLFGNYPDSCVQLTYRNLKSEKYPDGLLVQGGYYHLTCKITSDAAGTINLNGKDIELKVGENDVDVYFLHADSERVYGSEEYDNIYYTAIFLTTGEKLPKADLVLTAFKWEEFTPEALQAPTVTMNGTKATVADTANDASLVSGYEIGFFAAATDAEPKYTVQATLGETEINSASWDNGTYTVKARTMSASGQYKESAWSTSTEVTYTVENGALIYDIPFSTEANITSDGWYYWSENGETFGADGNGVTEAKYDDGTLTFEYAGGQSNWYSTQLFYGNFSQKAGTYQITLKITASAACIITVNGTQVTFTEDALTQEVTVNGTPGKAMLSIQFGVNGGAAVTAGRFTITDITIGSAQPTPPPAPTEGFAFGEEKNIADGWAYWNDQNWAGATVAVTDSELTENEDGSFTIHVVYNCTAGGTAFGFQIFYNSPKYETGKNYKLTLTATAKTDCTISINGQSFELKANTPQTIEIPFLYNYDGTAESTQYNTSLFDMQSTVVSGQSYDITLENIKWVEA